ncbi:hypothetical protein VE01_07490 [Pseudogymnoascus verrucosus]|uniref:Uncharacterized protein n=1 Tax=Pseudogymnoascus verrucosus TaxID=342668 RepID=A0A1B8GGI8_9PEZI|nr:uncharacterized protein VE01_07490 [Pseudogymnoascus verrucosus]OBT94923.1 hypothetical protein VE01_07490 [Pseudogymnoascus verrucosus]
MDPNPDPASHIHASRQRPHPSSSSASSPPFTLPAPSSALPPVDGPSPSGHNRSTSLTSLKRTFSKILPANRSERGGTLRDSQRRGDVDETVDVNDKGEEPGEQRRVKGKIVKGEGRRSRSWSPRKEEVMGSSEVEGVAEATGPGKEAEKESEKGGNAFQRLLGLRRTSLPATSTPAQPSTSRLSLRRPKPKKAIHFASPPTQIPLPTPPSRSGTSTPPLDSQQMYDQKRLRREQRRSYRSSEDYLTIAGANPRTGYWDVNTAIGSTSSSEVADRARAREAEIAENRRRLEAAKQELQEALAMREAEDRERDAKRARRRERDEARRREKRAREAGRWRAEGDGWRMVAEPGLSPIVGSLAGSPRMDRTPDDQLTEMRVPEEVVDKGYFGGEGREGRERGRSPEEERERRRLSRSPAAPSRLSRQVGDTNGVPAQSTPMKRKALPSASRVVSGDIPLYVASSSRKGGSSRKLSNDRVPELQSGQPSPVLERANPGRAAIFPSPRRQHHKPPFIDTGPETPLQGPRSPAISMGQSDNRKGSRGNALPNESVRRSPDRPNRDPFGPIPRRRPASPPKAVNTPPLDTQPAVETPRLEESTPVGERDVEPEVLRTEQQPHAVASSGVEAENRELEGSNDTIVRHSIAEALPGALPVDDRQRVPSDARKDLNERDSQINSEQSPFLGIRPEGQPEEPATAISSQSASTSPALTPHQSHQSLKDTDQGKRIKHIASMNELPPFVLKHPVTGTSLPIAPSSPKILEEVTNRSSKEIIGGDMKVASITTTTTITPTTGPGPTPPPLDQMDGSFDPRPSPKRRPMPLSRIPAPQVSPQSARNHLPSGLSPRQATGSATSLAGEVGATLTKRRIPRWYQKLLPGFGREVEKSTHTSTSTSPSQPPTSPRYHMGDPGGHPGAQNAARVALLNGAQAPSLDRGVQGQRAGAGVGALGAGPGGGNVGMSRLGSPVRIERGDKLVVWHAAPVVGPRRRNDIAGGGENKHVGTVTPNASSKQKRDASQPGGATLQQVLIVLLSTGRYLILAAWCFVEPVFDPRSALRARWERQEMTWRDGVVVVGAGVFGAAALLAAVLGVRVVGGVVRVVGVLGRGCRFLLGG